MTQSSALPRSNKHTPTKTVLVLGASYAGHRATQQLVGTLPSTWRVVVLERNTHFNHLYAFPRMSVVPGHEHKIFVPYTKVFQPPDETPTATNNLLLHGNLSSLSPSTEQGGKPALGRGIASYIPLDVHNNSKTSESTKDIHFDYLVYALGSQLPPPINMWSTVKDDTTMTSQPQVKDASQAEDANQVFESEITIPQTRGSKAAGVKWLQETQDQIRKAESILVIGGGALGVQYASDIAWTYGTAKSQARWQGHSSPPKPKKVTLLSSSLQILPRFQIWMHQEGVRSLEELGVEVITGSRADLNTLGDSKSGDSRIIKTLDGREIEANLVLFCTGQRPNTEYLQAYGNSVLDAKTGMAHVTRHLQLLNEEKQQDVNHIFVVGDAANAFGALNAGHNAAGQAEMAARNVARLVNLEEGGGGGGAAQASSLPWLDSPLEYYEPPPFKIKVSVGIDRAIGQNTGQHKVITDGKEDLNAPNMWLKRGLDISDMTV